MSSPATNIVILAMKNGLYTAVARTRSSTHQLYSMWTKSKPERHKKQRTTACAPYIHGSVMWLNAHAWHRSALSPLHDLHALSKPPQGASCMAVGNCLQSFTVTGTRRIGRSSYGINYSQLYVRKVESIQLRPRQSEVSLCRRFVTTELVHTSLG